MAGLTFKVETRGFGDIARRMAQAAPGVKHTLAVQMAKDTEPYVPARTKSLDRKSVV